MSAFTRVVDAPWRRGLTQKNSASLARLHNEADELYFFLRAFFLAAFFAFLAMQIPLRVMGRTGGRARPGTSVVKPILSDQSKLCGDNLARGPQRLRQDIRPL
jgi:hypothetical protein